MKDTAISDVIIFHFQTITYKTAAFEPVEADTPADAKLIELKETEHKHDILVPGPTQYISSPAVAYTHALGNWSSAWF